MRTSFRPRLVNPPFGDPCLAVELFEQRRSLLFDLGDISRLSSRQLLRTSDVFVSHTHLDHFVGFDRLLRVCLGRELCVRLYGPQGLIAQVAHKLAAYSWNLLERYQTELRFEVYELAAEARLAGARMSSLAAFVPEALAARDCSDGILVDEQAFELRFASLEHHIPVLAFSLRERLHWGVDRARLRALGLASGPWLGELKRVLWQGRELAMQAAVRLQPGLEPEALLDCFRAQPGEHLCYVVDTAYTPQTAARIVELARGADHLYMEARFLEQDEARAAERAHLTTKQCGELARLAGVKRLTPIHFSSRNEGEESRFEQEVRASFGGQR